VDERVRVLERGAARTDAMLDAMRKDIDRLEETVNALQVRVNRFLMGLLWLLLGGAGSVFTFIMQKFMS